MFKTVLGIDYEVTNAADSSDDLLHINYSNLERKGSITIPVHGLLADYGIKEHVISRGFWNEIPTIFELAPGNQINTLPFDLFSAIFYLIARYEEYFAHKQDEYGRYLPQNSVLWENGSIEQPIINQWLTALHKTISEHFPDLKFNPPKYRFQPTYDIDQTYAFKGKGFFRNLGGYLKDVAAFRMSDAFLRVGVLLGSVKDPYDQYAFLEQHNKKVGCKGIYFFLTAVRKSRFDKNTAPESASFRKVVQSLNGQAIIGIHPSFECIEKNKLKEELQALSGSLNDHQITKSRQHYLKLEFPETYRTLLEEGIEEDYSLGYPDQPGFRSGTCTPHLFYDLEKEQITSLMLFPLTIMDISLISYMKLSPEKAIEYGKKMIDSTRKYQGVFTLLWHNSSLTDSNQFKGWTPVYETLMEYAAT